MSKVFIVRLSRYSIYKVQCRSVAFISCPPRTFIYQHISFRLSRTFFKFLKKLFELSLRSRRRRSSHNFYILAHPIPFVKNYFQVFSNFFRIRIILLPVSGQLAYTTTLFPICQHFSITKTYLSFAAQLCYFHKTPTPLVCLSAVDISGVDICTKKPRSKSSGAVYTILYISMRSLLRCSSSAQRWGYGPAPWCRDHER